MGGWSRAFAGLRRLTQTAPVGPSRRTEGTRGGSKIPCLGRDLRVPAGSVQEEEVGEERISGRKRSGSVGKTRNWVLECSRMVVHLIHQSLSVSVLRIHA